MSLKKTYTFILHLLFWTLSIIIYLIYSNKESFLLFLFDHIIIALLCYLNYFILIPSLLKKNELKYFAIWITSYIIIFSLIYELWLYYISVNFSSSNDNFPILKNFLISFLVSIYYGGASTFARLAVDWNNNIKTNRDLSLQKTNTQIQLIKSNINIPFTLQSLTYAEQKAIRDPHDAVQPILQLSNILRYGLYESQQEFISLINEIETLNEYIDLHNQINPDFTIRLEIEKKIEHNVIIPNILVKSTINWREYLLDKAQGIQTIKIISHQQFVKIIYPISQINEFYNLTDIFPEFINQSFTVKREISTHSISLIFSNTQDNETK